MKKNKLKILSGLLLTALIALTAGYGFCDFDYLGVGARPAALGNCYTAFSDDAYGIYYNPGAIAFAKDPQLSTEFGQLWTGLTDGSNLSNGYLGAIYPKNDHAYGFSIQRFSLSGSYTENTIAFAYSQKVTKNASLGVNVKQLQQAYTMDEYTRVDDAFGYGSLATKSAVGIDPGLLWQFYPDYFMGLSIINLNQPDVGLAEKESLPIILNFAAGYRYNYPSNDFNLGIGISQSEGDYKILSGVEKSLFNGLLALRAGFGFGTKQYSGMSFGTGFKFKQAQVDYSISLPMGGIKGTNGTHRVSLAYKFGKRTEEDLAAQRNYQEEKEKIIQNYEGQIKQLENKISELDAKLQENQHMEGALPGQNTPDAESIRALQMQLLETQERLKLQKMQQAVKEKPKAKPVETPVEYQEAPSVPAVFQKEPVVKIHTVKEGESLPSIAQKYYNDSSQWKKIYEANKSKIQRGQVTSGQVLVIP